MNKIAIALVAAVVVLSGCRIMEPPAGFAIREDIPYVFSAFSADNVTLQLTIKDRMKAEQLFWKKAVLNEMTKQRGYRLVSEEPIETNDGLKGDLLTFGYEKLGRKYTYLTGVFTGNDSVAIAEALGEEELVAPEMENIRASMRTLRHKWLIFDRW